MSSEPRVPSPAEPRIPLRRRPLRPEQRLLIEGGEAMSGLVPRSQEWLRQCRQNQDHRSWRIGSSENWPVVGAATAAWVPQQHRPAWLTDSYLADWWDRLLIGVEGEIGWCGRELLGFYAQWRWLSSAMAYAKLGTEALRRDLRRHIAMWSVLSVDDLVVRRMGGLGPVSYRGPGVRCAGLRAYSSNAALNYITAIGAEALGVFPGRHRGQEGRIIELLVKRHGRGVLAGGFDGWQEDLALQVRHLSTLDVLIGDLRTHIPVVVERHADGSVTSMLGHNGDGRNTGALWCVHAVPGVGQRGSEVLAPYPRLGERRPQWIGRGQSGDTADRRYWCANLTPDEDRSRGGNRRIVQVSEPRPESVLRLELGPDHEPRWS